MKKTIISIMAMTAAIFAVSCQKEASVNASSNELSQFTAYVDGADQLGTKTVFDQTGKKSLWSGQERIWILNGDAADPGWKKAYAADVASPAATATFKQEDATAALTGTNFMAVYPAQIANKATWDGTGSVVNLWLNPEQTPVEGGYSPDYHIAIAQTTNNHLAFKNVVSFFKFTVGSDNVTEVCIFGANGEKIAGNFNVDYNAGNPTATVAGDVQATYAKIVAPQGQALAKGKTYYIAVLPADFTKGFTVEVVSNGAKGEPKTTAKPYTLTRNKVVDLGEVVYTPVKLDTRAFYLNVGCWDVLDATEKYDAWVYGGSAGNGIWVDFTQIGTTEYYETQIPADATGIKVYRRGLDMPSHVNEEDDKTRWNSAQINITAEHNCFNVTDWWAAAPGTYTPAK